MKFNEKLQELRKQKNLTQEELAKQLYVSRTAVSKWESGRGYPGIDSLKAISKFFTVSLDDLLSNEELLSAAQEDNTQKLRLFRDRIFGLLDCALASFFFLPFFGQGNGDVIEEVSLLSLTGVQPYVKLPYVIIVTSIVVCGLLILAFQSCESPAWIKYHSKLSLFLSTIAMLFFILSTQPYAAVFTFVFLAIKALTLMK